LSLNLGKSTEIVFRRSHVHMGILPLQLDSDERLECVKLLGVLTFYWLEVVISWTCWAFSECM